MRKLSKKNIRNIVIKLGTSVLTKNGRFDETVIEKLAGELTPFLKRRVHVTIVSSGAIGAGMTILKQRKRPKSMEGLQAAAAVGQRHLMQCWQAAFWRHKYSTAQVLLTRDDLHVKSKRYLNAKNTLKEIQRRGLVPIVNENDTVATDEIRFGDNDYLSALISILMEADALIILSDTDGYRDSKGRRIPEVSKITPVIWQYAKHRVTDHTRGGIRSKLQAVEKCMLSGIPVMLANGRDANVIDRVLTKKDLGTYFSSSPNKRKNWIRHFVNHIQVKK